MWLAGHGCHREDRRVWNWEHGDLLLTCVVLAGVFVMMAKEWVPAELAALAGLGTLLLSGILDEGDLQRVFSNTAPLTIGAMFILAEALVRTGAVEWIAHHFGRWSGTSELRALTVMAVVVMPLSAFLNNTPVVVVFLPVLAAYCRDVNRKPSKFLLPLSYLSILGGTMTLIGTSTTLLVAGVAADHGQQPFGIFEITKLGVIYAVVGYLYFLLVGRRLLPDRDALGQLHTAEDDREFCTAVEIGEGFEFVGKRLVDTPLFLEGRTSFVYEVLRYGHPITDIPLDAITIRIGDIIWLRATSKRLAEIRGTRGVKMQHETLGDIKGDDSTHPREIRTVEAIIGRHSRLVGRTVRQSNIRRRYGVVVAAVHRRGGELRKGYQDVRLEFGDTLLLEGPEHNIAQLQREEDFLSLSESKVTIPRKSRVLVASGIMLAVVLAAAFGLLPITSAAMVGAVAALLTRCLDLRDAYRAVEWNILFLIYGMLGIGLAMEKTGGAELAANWVVGAMGSFAPVLILAAIYMLASLLTEMVTNNAVAILLTPVVISIAGSLDVDPRPFIVAIMFGASASFITPIGYQTNTYIYGAGGYRFWDFTRVGVPLNLILWGFATLLIPWFWPL